MVSRRRSALCPFRHVQPPRVRCGDPARRRPKNGSSHSSRAGLCACACGERPADGRMATVLPGDVAGATADASQAVDKQPAAPQGWGAGSAAPVNRLHGSRTHRRFSLGQRPWMDFVHGLLKFFMEGRMTATSNSCRTRLSLACVAIIAQVLLAGSGCCHDLSCCTRVDGDDRCRLPVVAPATAGSACPLCRVDGSDQGQRMPCRCRLGARHDDVATSPARAVFDGGAFDTDFVALRPDMISPPSASLFRRMLDGSREIPSRPLRITFGVWRN